MKWTTADMEMYVQAKEYVDTAVVPLISINWHDKMKASVSAKEFIDLLMIELERQFKGRIMIFPGFTYLSSEETATRTARLSNWTEQLQEGGMPHVFYVTCDSTWKQTEQDLDGNLVWMPSLTLEHVGEKAKLKMIQEQVEQMMPLFMTEWKKSQKDT
ncbi:YpiF family protein [Bacillus tianshenii]|nr:YpiF family protein [Bacillus tianshenii]